MSSTVPSRIAASGLRVTRQRIAVLDSIDRGEHLDVDTVTQRVRDAIGSVSRQAVYDVLAALTGAGLLRRIEPAGQPARFEIRVADNHHHLLCRGCGQIVDIDCAVGEAPCLDPSAPADSFGYAIDEAEVTWWGYCPVCTTERSSQKHQPVLINSQTTNVQEARA
ncbi:MAG TPA: Fur family transcriptional regulator [Jatrophihabitans sp.]|jgi:Fe2+ or Zn2+ uptake regulation protein